MSGADDGYVKVWDRRSLSSSVPSGTLVGATEGITYTSPKGDGRYIVVNSKDQAARLYDLRKMKSWSEFESEPDAVARYGAPRYDCESGFSDWRPATALTPCRQELPVPYAEAARSPQRLFGHDLPGSFGPADPDSLSLLAARVHRPELHLQWQRRRHDSYLEP